MSKHGVDSGEVESVFELKLGIPIGRQVFPEVSEEWLCLIGPSHFGRLISVVFTIRNGKVRPTSIALEVELLKELRSLAQKQGIPYQVLMRLLIADGVKRLKKSA